MLEKQKHYKASQTLSLPQHNESQSAEASELMPANVTEQDEDDLALLEESDFEGFTPDDLL